MDVLLPRPARVIFHPVLAACGYYIVDFMLSFKGKKLQRPFPKNTAEAIKGGPSFPGLLINMLREAGEDGEVVFASTEEGRKKLFRQQLMEKRLPFAPMVGVSKIGISNLTPHWYAVCGLDSEGIDMYDPRPRCGPSSVRDDVPVGNCRISLPDLLNEWWGIRFVPRIPMFRDPTTGEIPHANEMRFMAVVMK